ncbi:MAG TPA: hypothetical protein VGJ05_02310 [Fimbriiglobus sp.]
MIWYRFALIAAVVPVGPLAVRAQTYPPTREERAAEALAEFEDKAIQRVAERQSKHSDTDRGRWMLELNRVYPGRCALGHGRADYDQWFELLAGGKPEWRKADATNRAVCDLFDRVTQKLDLGPVPTLKKEEFIRFANAVLRPEKNGPNRAQEQYGEADKMFRVLDRDGNGRVEGDEMTDRMRAVLNAETDGPTGFDRQRYREYFQGRVGTAIELMTLPTRVAENGPAKRPSAAAAKPVKGKAAPKKLKLPPWFEHLDADGDGQISLAEWRTDLLPLALFQSMDLNGDGLLTPDEYRGYVRQNAKTLPVELKMSAGLKK